MQTRSRLEYLDSLRGLAILSVISVHSIFCADTINSAIGGNNSKNVTGFFHLGQYGVNLFFVISGILMITLYPGRDVKFKLFWKRRLLRIMPLWMLFVVINLLRNNIKNWMGVQLYDQHPGVGIIPYWMIIFIGSATFLLWMSPLLWNSVVPGGWSIQSEIMHYAAFITTRKFNLITISTLLLIHNLVIFILYSGSKYIYTNNDPGFSNSAGLFGDLQSAYLRLGFYSTFFYFYIGMLIVEINKKTPKNVVNFFNSSNKILMLLFTLNLLIVLNLPLPFGKNLSATIYIIFFMLINSILMKKYWVNHCLKIIGKYSYCIYFIHFLILGFLQNTMIKIPWLSAFYFSQFFLFIVVFLLTLVISLILAIPSMKYFERYFIEKGAKN